MKTQKQRSESRKLAHFLEQVKNNLGCYAPPSQRKVIQLVAKGLKATTDISGCLNYAIGELEKLFDGREVSFRNKVLVMYLDTILPPFEAEYNKEVAIQDATDELLALTDGKTAQEIRVMIEVLRTNEVCV